MTDLQRFLQTFESEHATTVKVMKAYPADKLNWRPHERSFTARELMFRFLGEQMVMAQLPKGGFPVPPEEPPVPEVELEKILELFEQGFQEVKAVLKAVTEEDFNTKRTAFFGMDMKLSDACWVPVVDQIHHRGQLSVYIRLAGGKVPSIYGPSADDPGAM
jgi:uncharacterized damage-inducible protein DinB